MTKVEKIEAEVKTLNREELKAFRQWFNNFDAEAWDQRIEADARSGKLDMLAEKALEDHRAGRSREI
jgi:hypothetical protein